MYKSPIELQVENIVSDVEKQLDGYTVRCFQQIGVNVDRNELIKALEYDREQYEKGWNDRDAEIVRCKNCVYCKRFNDVWRLPKSDELLCTLYVATYHTTENDYCSHGERREDGKRDNS